MTKIAEKATKEIRRREKRESDPSKVETGPIGPHAHHCSVQSAVAIYEPLSSKIGRE